ncbi:MAG: hypothetical protein ACKVTZ_23145 [Bacteroidia bacterium]
MTQGIHYPEISKEALLHVQFPKGEVLNSAQEIQNRQTDLAMACRLGNEFKGKVSIAFMTSEGIREVTTTIWNVGEDVIMLKAGAFIPIHTILSVSYES